MTEAEIFHMIGLHQDAIRKMDAKYNRTLRRCASLRKKIRDLHTEIYGRSSYNQPCPPPGGLKKQLNEIQAKNIELNQKLKIETKRADDNASALATVTNALRAEQTNNFRMQTELTEFRKKRKGVKR